jgi:PmbA protein
MDQAVTSVIEAGRKRGLALDVMAVHNNNSSIMFHDRKMEQFKVAETRQLGVRVLTSAGHEGVAYTESLSADALDEVLNAAEANARLIQREFVSDLPGPAKLPTIAGIYDEKLAATPIEDKIETARRLEDAALSADARLRVPRAVYADSVQQVWLANSHGFINSYRTADAWTFSSCTAKDGEATVSTYEYNLARRFADVDPAALGRKNAEKTLRRIGAQRPRTGRFTVVLDQRTAESLLGMIVGYFSAKKVDEKLSPVAERLGQKVFSNLLTLIDNPLLPAAPGCRPFDDEGFPTRATTLVADGVVNQFLTNSVMAKKMGLAHTASATRSPSTDLSVGPSTVCVKPGTSDLKQLLSADRQVIVLTSILGTSGFRAASGDFSLPVEGLLYENGEPIGALKDFLISGNVLELLSAVEGVGSEVLSPIGGVISPHLLIRGVNIAGQG